MELPARKRWSFVLVATIGSACVCLASVAAYFVDAVGCLDDTTAREVALCHASGTEVAIVLLLTLLGPPVLAVVAGAFGVKRRRYWPAVAATCLLVPLTLVLAVLWG
jgi:hypothetical protein